MGSYVSRTPLHLVFTMTVERRLNKEDVKFFKKRSNALKGFASINLEAAAAAKTKSSKTGKAKNPKKKQKKDPVLLDDLERAEDEEATRLRDIQRQTQKKQATYHSDDGSDDGCEDEEEDEMDVFERRAMKAISQRENDGQESSSGRVGLPIRTATGEWKQNVVKVEAVKSKKTSEDPSKNTTAAATTTGQAEQTTSNTGADGASAVPVPKQVQKISLEEAKESLALLAMEITEELEENLSKLKTLLTYTRPLENLEGGHTNEVRELMQVGLITTLAVLKDILPGYYIRPLTDSEKNAVVSKEVRKLRAFDEAILRCYSSFLARLEEILKTNRRGDAALVPVAVACLGQMAEFAGHFNHFDRVLAALCNQAFKPQISTIVMKSIGKVWAEDELGRSTAHLLRLLSDAVQARGYLNLPSDELIQTLLSIRLKVLMFGRTDALPSEKKTLAEEAAKLDIYKLKSKHLSKSRRKELRAELEESVKAAKAEAEFSREERAKWSTDSAKFLFRILFGVLKQCEAGLAEGSEQITMLLPAVLKALARFAQLLSIEFFADLLATLKRVVTSSAKDSLNLDTALYTIQTVIQIHQLQETVPSAKGTAVVDLKFYYDLLYNQLPRLPREIGVWTGEFETLIEGCMAKLFLSKSHVPVDRVAAFAHRLAAVSARMEDFEGSKYTLRLICRLLERHEKARAVLDSEVLGVAAYRPECPDPDLCNPFCLQLDIDALVKRIQQRHGQLPGDLQAYIRKIKKLSLD